MRPDRMGRSASSRGQPETFNVALELSDRPMLDVPFRGLVADHGEEPVQPLEATAERRDVDLIASGPEGPRFGYP
jgi:hypothetical protein